MKFPAAGLAAAMLITPALASVGALACWFEDPNSAAIQRGGLSLSYPQALYVLGALTHARLAGDIDAPPPPTEVKDPFALLRTTRMLQDFGNSLRAKPHPGGSLVFSLVLVESMLWTRFLLEDGHVSTSVHVNGPAEGDVVAITTEAAMRAIVGGRLTASRAEHMGLIRIYGNPAMTAQLRVVIAEESKAGFR